MANLWQLKECADFIADWKNAFRCGRACMTEKGFFERVATEQRANFECINFDRKRHGRVPTWCNVDEYQQSVELLELTAAQERLRLFLN